MMAEQQQYKPGQGRAFPVREKKEDWHEDWTGRVVLPDGTEHYFSVYDRVGQTSGNPYKEIRIGRAVQNGYTQSSASTQNHKSQSAATPAETLMDLNDDMPF